ncbi:hypothetical protein N665_0914s0003 [Sinapis alba]|nr:hypothetical protein N665_0914s0003 [Sinapis alba]
MIILHWNCQGLRNPLTIPYLRDINRKYKIDILFLVETKNKDSFVQSLGKELQYPHSFVISPEGLGGGLAIFWRDTIECNFFRTPTLYQTDILVTEGSSTFCLTYVYGNPQRQLRQQQWSRMANQAHEGWYRRWPRLVIGDLNDIKDNTEKEGGSLKPEWYFQRFRSMLSSSGLHEVKTYGGVFTWIGNTKKGMVKTKIDRALATADWQDLFPKAWAQLLGWIGSDHRPLLLYTEDKKWKGKKLFRYDNRWRSNEEVKAVVRTTWQERCVQLSPYQFKEALKRCRHSLSKWKMENHYNTQKRILQLQDDLHRAYDSYPLDYHHITELKSQLNYEYKQEEEYWRTKSRVLWLKYGDKNTRFFHAKAKQRRSHNRITSLQDEQGQVKISEREIEDIILNYFNDLYTSSCSDNIDEVILFIKNGNTYKKNKFT